MAGYNKAKKKLASERHQNNLVGATAESADEMTSLLTQLEQDYESATLDREALTKARQIDFTGIKAAREKAAAEAKEYAAAKRKAA